MCSCVSRVPCVYVLHIHTFVYTLHICAHTHACTHIHTRTYTHTHLCPCLQLSNHLLGHNIRMVYAGKFVQYPHMVCLNDQPPLCSKNCLCVCVRVCTYLCVYVYVCAYVRVCAVHVYMRQTCRHASAPSICCCEKTLLCCCKKTVSCVKRLLHYLNAVRRLSVGCCAPLLGSITLLL
jgi:hypothetical protein